MAKRLQLLSSFLLTSALVFAAGVPQFKPGFNLFSKDQDIQLGREAAAQVEQQMQVVRDARVQDYIKRIGQRLASQPQAGGFPYSFQVVNDPSVNAFALPGGPTFVNTGLILAADNEAQLAGVMAHELSHVALRHGTNQASKAQLLQIPAAIMGASAGGSLLGQLTQLGVGLGFNSVLLKFSRSAESQADLNGAQIMAGAGYNPVEMARFFEKLEAQGGHSGPQFLSDHPNPGNRRQAIEDEIRYFPQRNYMQDSGEFRQIQQIVRQIGPPSKTRYRSLQQSGGGSAPNASSADARPSNRLRDYRSANFSFSYPDNWEVFGDSAANSLTVGSRAAMMQDANGQVQVGYGIIMSYFADDNNVDLVRDTDSLIRQLQQSNRSMEVGQRGRRVTVDGNPGLATTLYSSSPYQGETEHDTLVTVARPEGLFYMVFIAPARDAGNAQNAFENILRSVRFNNNNR
jgi:Zn-dependent protease with chaperone function